MTTTTETNGELFEYDHRATYCPEDNKLRFYPSTNSGGEWNDPDFDKEDLKTAGYRWASKQECYVCPRWTPAAEDAALDYAPTIEDETYSPAERSADRAERFQGYREKRRADAHGYADRMGAGVVGYQDQRRADRAARKRDRLAGHSLTMWDRPEYWQSRTGGVISHAIGRENPATRRTRIKKLESDQRGRLKSLKERAERLQAWAKVAGMEGADVLLPLAENGYGITPEANEAGRLAYVLANDGNLRVILQHPRDEAANDYAANLHGEYHRGFSTYDLLTNDRYAAYGELERLTPGEVARLYLEQVGDPSEADDYGQRWAKHYAFRLEFERAMLAEEGGAADNSEIIPGGFIKMRGEMGRWLAEEAPSGWVQVQRVHKSRSTGKASSVEVWGVYGRHCAVETKPGLVKVNIERFAADRYRPPTPEELEAFQAEQKAAKKAKAKKKTAGPKLINPTPEDAERLQMMLNALERDEDRHSKTIESTQAAYSSQSKGNYANGETTLIGEKGRPVRNYHGQTATYQRIGVFKVRTYTSGRGGARRVVIITDKPQKPLPFEAIDEARAKCPTEESTGRAFAELFNRHAEWGYEFGDLPEDEREAAKQLRKDCGYLGWADISCANQFTPTETGRKILDHWREVIEAETVAS